jgi:cardiolipin synthase
MGFTRKEIEKIYKSPFIDGNSIELLASGKKAFKRIFDTVAEANEMVCLQFYIYRNDETGVKLAELLKEKAKEGVAVYLLYDQFGSFGTPRRFWRELREAGIKVKASYPFIWKSPRRYIYRDHRKVLIIDGRTAFTGGLNIASEYHDGLHLRRKEPWRDTGIIINGPAAGALLDTFKRAWRRWSRETLHYQTGNPGVRGKLSVIPIFAHSGKGRRRMRRLLYYSINHAKKDICLTTAYFTPSRRLLWTLEAAVRRGVRVRLLVPGHGDVPAVHYAGRASFARLLKAGVEIFNYTGAMLHAKSYVFDCTWSIVGSANLDFRSLRWNDEGNVGILDEEFAGKMTALFADDLKHSVRITLEEWIRRPFIEKLKEKLYSLFRRKL